MHEPEYALRQFGQRPMDYYDSLGVAGPAAEGDAHVVDEQLAVADLLAAARGYRGLVEAVLAGDN